MSVSEMSEDKMRAMVMDALEAKLGGNKSIASEPEVESAPEEKAPPEEPTTLHLDPDDTVRLENFILKQHVENLTRQLEDDRRSKFDKSIIQSKEDYQTYLAEKYDVNTDTHKIQVDAKTYNLTISPLNE